MFLYEIIIQEQMDYLDKRTLGHTLHSVIQSPVLAWSPTFALVSDILI